ncbi:MAG: hypothetical protein WCO06_01330, partial [Candidatus Roizmanbacteria bacterium]
LSNLSGAGLVVLTTGNVGIGTTAPKDKLSVNGSANIGLYSALYNAPTNGLLVSGNSYFGDYYGGNYISDRVMVHGGALGLGDYISAANTKGLAPIRFYNDYSSVSPIADISLVTGAGGYTDYGLQVSTAGSERMRILANGNVGIGTTGPSAKLEIAGPNTTVGTSATAGQFRIQSNSAQAIDNGGTISFAGTMSSSNMTMAEISGRKENTSVGNDRAYLQFTTNGVGGISERMRINSDGNVGIGVTSPIVKLEIPGNTLNNVAKFGSFEIGSYTTNNDWITDNMYFDGGNWVYRANGYGNQIYFSAGNILFGTAPSGTAGGTATITTAMKISSNGNVGIGTTGPGTALQVREVAVNNNYPTLGTASGVFSILSNEAKYGLFAGVNNGSGNVWMQAQRSDGTATAYSLVLQPSGGNVGIGTTNPLANLHVWGGDGGAGTSIVNFGDYAGVSRFAINGIGNVGVGGLITNPLSNLSGAGLVVLTTGNVGIGTTAPLSKLHISDGGTPGIGGGVAPFRITGADSATYQAIFESKSGNANGGLGGIQLGNSTGGGNQNAQLLFTDAGSNTLDIRTNYVNAANKITFSPGASTAMTLLGNGNVGIGTTAPTNILSLGGNAARTFWMENGTVANTAGFSLTVQSGGATAASTDKAGGDLIISSGIATGTGGSNIYIKTATPATTGTGNNAPSTKITIQGNGVLLPFQAPTASAPAYVLGGMYFDTTLNKLRIGGATAWETVTSI